MYVVPHESSSQLLREQSSPEAETLSRRKPFTESLPSNERERALAKTISVDAAGHQKWFARTRGWKAARRNLSTTRSLNPRDRRDRLVQEQLCWRGHVHRDQQSGSKRSIMSTMLARVSAILRACLNIEQLIGSAFHATCFRETGTVISRSTRAIPHSTPIGGA